MKHKDKHPRMSSGGVFSSLLPEWRVARALHTHTVTHTAVALLRAEGVAVRRFRNHD